MSEFKHGYWEQIKMGDNKSGQKCPGLVAGEELYNYLSQSAKDGEFRSIPTGLSPDFGGWAEGRGRARA